MKQLALDIGLASGPTLSNYLPGPNQAAVQHLRLALEQDLRPTPRRRVPTYLWGPMASGKTHLLKAVRAALREQGAGVGWLSADQTEPAAFDERWAAVLLDDVQRYSDTQQHIAFNWFVQAENKGLWVLAAGDVAANALKLREDLRSRLSWGHAYGLEGLSESERRAVLRQTADARGVFLRDDVMDFMLTRFSRDLDSLMQLLDHLDRYALQTQRPITIPLLKTMLESE